MSFTLTYASMANPPDIFTHPTKLRWQNSKRNLAKTIR